MLKYIVVALLSCLPALAGGAERLSDEVLVDAFEKGGSFLVVTILGVRAEEEQGIRMYFYKAKCVELVVPGDLSSGDVAEPVDLFAGASYGNALQVGTDYGLFVTKDAPFFMSWAHRDAVLRIDRNNTEIVKQLTARVQSVYEHTRIRDFREAKIVRPAAAPRIQQDLLAVCEEFRNGRDARHSQAKRIWESELGSRRDESHPFSSIITWLPPVVRLSRSETVALLGDPTLKTGHTYKWYCGKYDNSSIDLVGVLSVTFDADESVATLLYTDEPLRYSVKGKKPQQVVPANAADDKMTDQEGVILALVLRQSYTDEGYTVVSPEATLLHHMIAGDAEKVKQSKKYIREHLQTNGVDVAKLVDRLFERNKKAVRLLIKSSRKDGYIIDYDGKHEKYFKQDGGGWEEWYKENPNAHGMTTVSLPVYDEKSGLVLVYTGTQAGGLAGAGWMILYKYEKGELKELKKVMMWIS